MSSDSDQLAPIPGKVPKTREKGKTQPGPSGEAEPGEVCENNIVPVHYDDMMV